MLDIYACGDMVSNAVEVLWYCSVFVGCSVSYSHGITPPTFLICRLLVCGQVHYLRPMQISSDLTLVLASKSPRRSYLLEQAGIPFEIRTSDVDEVYPEDLDPLDIAPFLAELKADHAQHLLQNTQEVLLTADSVVLIDGVKHGKPKNRDHAIETLEKLSGRSHVVVTGCCLLSQHKKEVFSSVATVHVDVMSREEIEWYVDKYEPYDKAGAYAIQEWVGLAKISKIEGTYPCIMGLPVDKVYDRLVNW